MIIKWFKNKVTQWVREDWNNASKSESNLSSPSVIKASRGIDQHGMNFTVYHANGGYVMEYSMYDRKTDRRDTALHIITSDQDLGQGIAHIITLEMLRK
jgi:hypothetical protein